MPACHVYGLFDPRDGELRYVGLHVGDLDKRMREHLCLARRGKKLYVYDWIRAVLRQGENPEIYSIQQLGSENEMLVAEVYWISYFKKEGCRLTNLTDGGEGCFGYRHTEETKQKMRDVPRGPQSESAKLSRRSLSPEQEVEIAEMYVSGFSCNFIGPKFGMGYGGIRKVLLRHGVQLRNAGAGRWSSMRVQGNSNTKLSDQQQLEVIEKYNMGMSAEMIADEFGVSGRTILDYLRKHGVARRSSGQLWTQDRIDNHRALGLMVDINKEMDIKQKYESGLSMLEVGRQVGLSPTGIKKVLVRNGVQVRPRVVSI